MGIRNFKNKSSEELVAGIKNKRTRHLLPEQLHFSAIKKIHILRAATDLNDLIQFPGLRLELLKGTRKEEYNIRINRQFRICFKWKNGEAYDVFFEDYH